MAKQERGPKPKSKKPSMRDLAAKKPEAKKRRLKVNTSKAATPLKKARDLGRKEYHLIKLPDNRIGRLLNKRGRIVPRYFRDAWQEIRKTTWPGRRETIRLTIAVFIFSAVFAVIVAALDFVLDKIFRNIITG